MLDLFQHLIPRFLFLCLAYAELKVNFVEGFARLKVFEFKIPPTELPTKPQCLKSFNFRTHFRRLTVLLANRLTGSQACRLAVQQSSSPAVLQSSCLAVRCLAVWLFAVRCPAV